MNFQDYLKSDGLKKSYNVMVTEDDCLTLIESVDPNIKYRIQLMINGDLFEYVVLPNSNNLRCIDQDGNPTGFSCFTFYDQSEKSMIESYLKKQDANSVIEQLYNKPLAEVIFPKFTTQIERKRI